MSKGLVIGSVGLAMADTTVSNLKSGKSLFGLLLGGWIVLVGLLVASENHEKVADGMALLILVTTLTGNGAIMTTLTSGLNLTGSAFGKNSAETGTTIEPTATGAVATNTN